RLQPATLPQLIRSLAVRKHRGGKQGQEFPFQLRMVEAPEKDEDGDPITTMVVDWLPPGSAPVSSTPDDPWAKPKRHDQRTAVLRLKRVLMAILADLGVDFADRPGWAGGADGGSELSAEGLLRRHTGR